MSPTAHETLDRLTSTITAGIEAWDQTLRSHHAEPGDARLYTAATRRSLDLAASRLSAEQPAWLDHHLGRRPTDVAGARTWDSAVTTIARWQLTHPDGPADDPSGAHQLRTWLAQTRTWLDTANRTAPTAEVTRTTAEIDERRTELQQIFDTAPADCQHLIDRIQGGQLALGDVDELLRTAVDQQDARRVWILEHWPHIVEHAELDRASSAPQMTLDVS